jgi:hypothetical protein
VPAKERSDAWGPEYFTWVGWREVWIRELRDEFKLHDATFTFYAGRNQIEPIGNQLFRAEWPQSTGASGKSAHPHWHVDWPLENLADEVSGIHFGMAGWNCNPDWQEGEHVSGNWRRDLGGDIRELEIWAVRTLEYSLDQIAACYDPQIV